jgi:CheY-like chemotaxis protein
VTVFISHSFADKAQFENVTAWLDERDVAYWKPAEIKSGASLRGQLRDAVNSCSVCIFVATHKSVVSSWCGAELGAFWGANTPIIVYLADSSLEEDALPPILQGDVWEQSIPRVVKRAAELVEERASRESGAAVTPGAKVSDMTAEQLEKLIAGAVSLVRAGEDSAEATTGPNEHPRSAALDAAGRVLRAADATSRLSSDTDGEWRRTILWVDDRPDNNTYEREVFESLGLSFDLALSTDEALAKLSGNRYGAVISDMGRREGPREGYVLLDAIRKTDTQTPYFIYAGSNSPEHRREAAQHGAQGSTNRPSELVDMVTAALQSAGYR